jgi:putative aldouronate transport system substrate-binding protein
MSQLCGRRRFLGGAISVGAAALAAACGSDNGPNASPGVDSVKPSATGATDSSEAPVSGGSSALPSYAPYNGVKPDLPSTSDLVLAGFFQYPADLVQFASSPPLSGGDVQVMTNTNIAIPPPVDKNKFWQELNKEAGANIKYTMVTESDYKPKFETAIAGNDLPEIMSIRPVAGLPDLLKSRFTDLRPWLSGENVKKYPALANIPTLSWRSSVYDGGLYTIPIPRPATSGEMAVRVDLTKPRGGNTDIKSYADFLALCRAVNDPKNNKWAMGNPNTTLNFIREMTGNANTWRNTDGKFTFYGEEDSYKQALGAVASMWKEGLFHPDAFTQTVNVANWMRAGIIAMANGSQSYGYYNSSPDPNLELTVLVPPKYDGGGDGHKYYGNGDYGGGLAIRKASDTRVEQLLGFFNWLAAPFGTKEYLFFQYGVEGVDYTLKDGAPVTTSAGTAEMALPVKYTGAPAYVNTTPGHPEYTKLYYDWQIRCAKIAMTPPTLGLYSATDQSKGATLTKNLTDLTNDIIQGRKKLDDWDDGMKAWKSGGGDTIRDEYEKAYEAAQ